MNKTELIESIAAKAEISQKDAGIFLNALIDVAEDTLKSGDSIVIPGFGSFVVAERAARKARDFRTGQNVDVPASRCVRFKVGKTLKDMVK
jgi:DNA-binding protein HU-beta